MEFNFTFLTEKNQNDFINIIMNISDGFFSYSFNKDTFSFYKKYLDIKNNTSFILYESSIPVGVFFGAFRGKKAYIAGMVISEKYRSQGYGKVMLQKGMSLFSENDCKEIYLDVLEDNKNAIKLYQSEGFKIQKKVFNFVNEKNSFFTREKSDFIIEKKEGVLFQPLYRKFHREERVWLKGLRSLISLLENENVEFYIFKKNSLICGYCIFKRENNILKIFDIILDDNYNNSLPGLLSHFLKGEKIVQINGFYEDEKLGLELMKNGFLTKINQIEMKKNLSESL